MGMAWPEKDMETRYKMEEVEPKVACQRGLDAV